jgi:SAM-dependent methyltransferase
MPEFVVEFDQRAGAEAGDERLDSPTFHRNFPPMLDVLQRLLGDSSGHVLEIGSGTGQHAVGFAQAMPGLTWWPSDPNPKHLKSIEAWRRHSGLANVGPPLAFDVTAADWPLGGEGQPPEHDLAAIVSMNVIHIAPWAVCEGILRLAGRHLRQGGLLVLYGPYRRGGAHTAPSNAAFDAALRRENAEWGVRDVGAVETAAAAEGLRLREIVEMPANNLVLVLEREADER